jgi:HAD superfamily hydrolase (TIGR01490 family)
MQIALFDLDHTLIPFDSGAAFTRHLAARGALEAGFEAQYLDHCRRYAAGSVDMAAMHRFTVGALAVHSPEVLARWLREFEPEIAMHVPAAAHALVRHHQEAGHACALVTATTRFVAEVFASVLGLAEVLATEPERDAQGRYTGEIVGEACFRQHKLTHVKAWLARRGKAWSDVERSWFYSDSINDLPLLQAVTDPVVVEPDPMLRVHALAQGWPVCTLLDACEMRGRAVAR